MCCVEKMNTKSRVKRSPSLLKSHDRQNPWFSLSSLFLMLLLLPKQRLVQRRQPGLKFVVGAEAVSLRCNRRNFFPLCIAIDESKDLLPGILMPSHRDKSKAKDTQILRTISNLIRSILSSSLMSKSKCINSVWNQNSSSQNESNLISTYLQGFAMLISYPMQ